MSDTLAQNPYAAPSSALQEQHGNQVPSIEEALSRGYDFSIGGLLSEAWGLLKGTKGIILGGFIVFYIAMFVIAFVLGMGTALLGLAGGVSLGPEHPIVLVRGERPYLLDRLNYLADSEYAGRFDANPYHS